MSPEPSGNVPDLYSEGDRFESPPHTGNPDERF
jgi:hypothetical protein